jgi:hypothetical protein
VPGKSAEKQSMEEELLMSEYWPIEFPKWVCGVLAQDAAEERALSAVMVEAATETQSAERVRPTSSAALRMRRTRERQKAGRRAILCDISTDQIEALALTGLLDPAKLDDTAELARGVGRLIDWVTLHGTIVTPRR